MIRPVLFSLSLWLPLMVQAEQVSFCKDIAPILVAQCQSCHGGNKVKGDYRVDTYARAMKAGSSELPAFVAHRLDESEAYFRLTAEDEGDRMPAKSDPLLQEQIALFKRWIEEGATFDGDDPFANLSTKIPERSHPKAPEHYAMPVPVTALTFTPGGDALYVSGHHEITVWSCQDGTLLRRIGNQGERTLALAMHPREPWLAAAGGNPGRLGELRVFHRDTGELLHILAKANDVVLCAAFSPSGNLLAVGGADGVIRLYQVPHFEDILSLTNHSDWITALAWNASGDRLVSGSRDKTSKVFQLPKGNRLITYAGHEKAVNGVFYHPLKDNVFSTSADGSLDQWKVEDGKRQRQLSDGLQRAFSLSLSKAHLFITSSKTEVEMFELENGKRTATLAGPHQNWITSSAFDPQNNRLATGDHDGMVCLWDIRSRKLLHSFVANPQKTSKP